MQQPAVKLYKAMVRSHTDYCSSVWTASLDLRKDVDEVLPFERLDLLLTT